MLKPGKKSIFIAAVLASWLASSCRLMSVRRDDLAQKCTSAPLHINTTQKHYAVDKPRACGERELIELARNSALEEGWLYVRARSHDGELRERWYELGTHEKLDSVSSDHAFIRALATNDAVEHAVAYHIHPRDCRTPSKSETFSERDYLTHFVQANDLYGQGFRGKFKHAIVVPSGVYRISLNRSALKDEKALLETASDAAYKLLMHRGRAILRDSGLIDDGEGRYSCDADNSALNKELASTISSDAISVSYTPATELQEQLD